MELAPVRLMSLEGREGFGEIKIQTWTRKDKSKAAFKRLGLFWGLAVAAVFVPILHFVLVPGFLIGGIVTSLLILKRDQMVLGGSGQCPDCGKRMEIQRSGAKFPISDTCDNCRHEVKIDLA